MQRDKNYDGEIQGIREAHRRSFDKGWQQEKKGRDKRADIER